MIKTCPPYDPATHRPVPDAFDEMPDGAGGTQLVQRIDPIKPEEIAAAKAAARDIAVAENNEAAGRAREAYLTAVPGQATTYAAKQAETQRWIDAGRPSDATAEAYPWAGDRAGLRTVTVADVLAEWEAVTAAWEMVGRKIERERERVNDAIGAADTPEMIQAARDSADYPAP